MPYPPGRGRLMTFEDVLAAWLVKQRWFAGKGRTVHDLAVVADTEIVPGDPGLRHLLVTVSHGATSDCYQVFIGRRARLPSRLRHVRIGTDAGMEIYDGLHDSALTRMLLDSIVADRTVGPLRFRRVPGTETGWADDGSMDSLVLTGEQSNTSLVFGESAIFKVFRRVAPGPNPDLEVAVALADLGSTHIAEPYGWVETRMDGVTTVLAILSRYLRAASDGWSLAATSVRDLYAWYADGGLASVDHNFSAARGKFLRHGKADAFCRTSDQRAQTRQIDLHEMNSLAKCCQITWGPAGAAASGHRNSARPIGERRSRTNVRGG